MAPKAVQTPLLSASTMALTPKLIWDIQKVFLLPLLVCLFCFLNGRREGEKMG